MKTVRALGSAVLAAAVIGWTALPAVASDPSPTLPPPPDGVPLGVHAEMLAANPTLPPDVTVMSSSPTPGAVESLAEVGTLADAGPAGRLPNGLLREVFGYLPYWELGSEELAALRYDLVSTIAYFGVSAASNGDIVRSGSGWSGWMSTNLSSVISAAHARGVRVVITVTQMNTTAMATLLGSASNRSRLVGQIAGLIATRGIDGVNLDFEPVPSSLRDAYTSFVREVKAGLVAAGVRSYLTVATMAGAASWSTGYDVAALTQAGAADAIMVMGYDFSWRGSARAGGVAPISNPYILDVGEAMAAHLQYVDPAKIIWGVPYYGRVWPTATDQVNSLACTSTTVCPSSKIFSPAAAYEPTYIGAKSLAAQYGRRWDAAGQGPYAAWYDATNTTWRQAYYDDASSLAVKYDLIRGKQMAGVGIWALGMDAGTPELWNVISAKFLRRDTRLAGSDRYETAAAVSRYGFPDGAPVAYLATGANFPDALAGGVLAARTGGPVLLVTRDTIPPSTATELTRLEPERIVVLGGIGAVSDAVLQSAAALATTGQVERIAGADRYQTAVQASASGFPNGAPVAYLVTGQNYPDALSGGVLAARSGGPILLVRRDQIPATVAAELRRLKPASIVIIGGAAVVSDVVLNAARAYATSGSVERIAGADRYQTAAAVSARAFPAPVGRAFIATGASFPDALAAAPVAAIAGGPLLLLQPLAVPAATATELYRLNPSSLLVLGGTAVISEQLVLALHESFR